MHTHTDTHTHSLTSQEDFHDQSREFQGDEILLCMCLGVVCGVVRGVTVCDTLAVRVCTEELLIETFIVSFGTREKTVYTSVYGGTLYISSDIC